MILLVIRRFYLTHCYHCTAPVKTGEEMTGYSYSIVRMKKFEMLARPDLHYSEYIRNFQDIRF